MSKRKNPTAVVEEVVTSKQKLEQEVREFTRMVTNQKAHIFDIIEDRTIALNKMAEHNKRAEALGAEIVKQQQVLEGQRKVLADKKRAYDEQYPEVTVNKAV